MGHYTSMLLLALIGGCSQSTTPDARLDDSQKAAVREVQGIATAAANLLNVYMDARVTDVQAFAATCERLRQALTTPEERADASRLLQEWLKISGAHDAVLLLDKNVCAWRLHRKVS